MQTVTLSEAAVATLRFEVEGRKFKVRDIDLPGYRELVDAGIMEADGERFRFTPYGMEHGESIAASETDRIERNRFEPPDVDRVTAAGTELLRQLIADRVDVTPENRPAFRELAAARIIVLGGSFAGGPESAYNWTYWGYHRRYELLACAKESV
jgi:hypothetical protein